MDSRISVQRVDPHGEVASELIGELLAELSRRYADQGDEEAEAASFHPAEATVPRSLFLVATLDEEPVGCGALRPMSDEVVEIKRMYVREHARGHGVGRAILSELERMAAEFGYASMILATGVRQPEAIALYTRAGFERMANFGEYVGNPLSVCLRKGVR